MRFDDENSLTVQGELVNGFSGREASRDGKGQVLDTITEHCRNSVGYYEIDMNEYNTQADSCLTMGRYIRLTTDKDRISCWRCIRRMRSAAKRPALSW